MSRKVKYRVWDNENKSYNDPYSYAYYALTQDGRLDFYCHGDRMDEADPDVYFIEQYAGLKDKNGKEIYEGDILDDGEGHIGKVLYNERIASFAYEWGNCGATFMSLYTSDMKVIGNIHENPELLEEE